MLFVANNIPRKRLLKKIIIRDKASYLKTNNFTFLLFKSSGRGKGPNKEVWRCVVGVGVEQGR